MSVYIVLAITIATPRIGVAATIGLVIAGNLVMAAAIDPLGPGSPRTQIPIHLATALLGLAAAWRSGSALILRT